MTVVSDASPLHYLVLIEAEHVLAQLFSEVVVPPAVLRELAHERAPERVRRWASHSPRSSKRLSEFARHCWPLSSPTSNTVAPKAHSGPNGKPMTMKSKKRKALTAAGWRVGEAADFLGLTADRLVADWLSPVW